MVIDPAGGEFDVMARRVLAAATPDLLCHHSTNDKMPAQT